MNHKTEPVLLGRWKLYGQLGEGAYGIVFLGYDLLLEKSVAVKIAREEQRHSMSLEREANILRELTAGAVGAALQLFADGYNRFDGLPFLVLELLGRTVKDFRRPFNRRFTHETCVAVALKMLDAIEKVHSCGFIHGDVKPASFAFTHPLHAEHLVLFDFGLAKPFRHLQSKQIIPPRDKPSVGGTMTYSSIGCLNLKEMSRREDLVSFFYSLVDIFSGAFLPWRNLQDRTETSRAKQTTHMEELCSNVPHKELLEFYEIVVAIGFYDEPPYDDLRSILKRIASPAETLDWSTAEGEMKLALSEMTKGLDEVIARQEEDEETEEISEAEENIVQPPTQ